MKILGLIIAVLGWLIAISSTQASPPGLQLSLALLGFLAAAVGVVAVLNRAHLKDTIWKH